MIQKIEATEYGVAFMDAHIVVGVRGHYIGEWPERQEAVLEHKETGRQELWMESDRGRGVIEIDGVEFEFVRNLPD